jgi:hypothetical protein
VPLLGDIPLLGRLFRNDAVNGHQDQPADLHPPTIIRDDAAARGRHGAEIPLHPRSATARAAGAGADVPRRRATIPGAAGLGTADPQLEEIREEFRARSRKR